ncbi:MAG: carboxypeptidase-like regulatory domain-containing protein, partial [Bacteroidales bacterium]|nr:carboxypeptidase-like regulatory domain-containing protein [Bacteroidales bacterium]
MKKFTKLFLLMLAFIVSSSFLFAQTQFEKDYNLAKQQQIKAAYVQTEFVTPTEPADGTMAQGDACTDPFDYGLINDPPVNSATTFAGDADWYEFTGNDDMTVTVSLCGSAFDTKLEVWNDCSDPGYAYYNDDACGAQSEITGIPFVAGDVMYVKVYGYSSYYGAYILNITGVLPPPGPDPIVAFPFVENFESGSFPAEMQALEAAQSHAVVSSSESNGGAYSAILDGGSSSGFSGGSTSCTYNQAFVTNVSHHASINMLVQPVPGEPGLLTLEFDKKQNSGYGVAGNRRYSWYRVMVDGVDIPDKNGNTYYWASYNQYNGPWDLMEYDLTAYQGLSSFELTIQTSCKYNYGAYNGGDWSAIDNLNLYYELPPGSIDGHVFNGDGLTISGATVGIDDLGLVTTSAPDGFYSFNPVQIGTWDIQGWKEGYNLVTSSVTVNTGANTVHDIILTQPGMVINPLQLHETLNPNEWLKDWLGILNTGDGPLGWTAVINYPPGDAAQGYQQDITKVKIRDFSNVSDKGALSTIPGGNGQAMNTRGLECPDGSVFAYPAVGANNGYTSDGSYQSYQSFAGATGAFTTVTGFAIHTSAPSGPRELLVEVYQPGSTPGALVSSTIAIVDPVNTGVQVIGYDTYSYTIEIPSCDLTDGWVSIYATAGGSPTWYWLNTFGTPSYPAMQNTLVLPEGLALCLSGGSSTSGWLTLDAYEGTVAPMGGS